MHSTTMYECVRARPQYAYLRTFYTTVMKRKQVLFCTCVKKTPRTKYIPSGTSQTLEYKIWKEAMASSPEKKARLPCCIKL